MGSENKRIAKNTLFMYLRMFFTMCVSLYTSRLVLAALGFSDYGLFNVIGGIIVMFTFINAAMSNTTSRYITFYLGKNDTRYLTTVFSVAFFIHCFIAVIIVILGETVGLWFLYEKMVIPEGRMDAAFWLYQLSVLSMILMILSVPFTSDIIAHERMSVYAYLSIIDVVLKLVAVYLLDYAPFDQLVFYALLIFGIQLIDFIFNLTYCRWHFIESKIRLVWDKPMVKEMCGFTGWSLIGNFSHIFYTQGLNILLNLFCGPVVNAARGIAVQVEAAMAQFTNSIQTAINPQIVKSYSCDDRSRMNMLIFASSRYCFFLMLFLSLPVVFGAHFILGLWLGDYPDHTVTFIRLTLVCTLFDTLVNPLFTANLATGKVAIYNKSLAVLSIIFMPLTYLAIRWTHIPEIVFIMNIFRNSVGLFVRMFIFRCQLGVGIWEYSKNVLFRVLPVAVLAFLFPFVVYKLSPLSSFPSFIVMSVAAVLSTTSAVYMIGLNKYEREYLISRGKKIILSKIV